MSGTRTGRPGAAAGGEWTEIATHLVFVPYSADHEPAAEYVRALRPDLTYIGVIPWDWDRSRMDA